MVTHVTIPDSDIDPDSPITTPLLTALRDNNIKHLLATASASSSASVEFTSGIDSTYELYEVEMINVLPATDGADFEFAFSQDAGVSWEDDGVVAQYQTGTSAINALNLIDDVENTTVWGGASGSLTIVDPAETSHYPGGYFTGQRYVATSQSVANADQPFLFRSASAVNGVRVRFDTGNIVSGEFRLYGISA